MVHCRTHAAGVVATTCSWKSAVYCVFGHVTDASYDPGIESEVEDEDLKIDLDEVRCVPRRLI